MRFVADVCMDWPIVRGLSEQHGRENVYWMKEEALKQKAELQLEHEPSIPDSVVRQRAIEREALLLTHDKSFAREMERENSCPPHGVMLVDVAGNGNQKAERVLPFIQQHQAEIQGNKTYLTTSEQRIGGMEQENVFPKTRPERQMEKQTKEQGQEHPQEQAQEQTQPQSHEQGHGQAQGQGHAEQQQSITRGR